MTSKRVVANGYGPSATGFQVPSRHLVIGGTLFGVGGALCIAGLAISGSGLLSSLQRWVAEMDRPPSEIAKGTMARARAAATAGARAWQDENAVQQTSR